MAASRGAKACDYRQKAVFENASGIVSSAGGLH
jgi:hypothetical protein